MQRLIGAVEDGHSRNDATAGVTAIAGDGHDAFQLSRKDLFDAHHSAIGLEAVVDLFECDQAGAHRHEHAGGDRGDQGDGDHQLDQSEAALRGSA